jgi:hypothetical protein
MNRFFTTVLTALGVIWVACWPIALFSGIIYSITNYGWLSTLQYVALGTIAVGIFVLFVLFAVVDIHDQRVEKTEKINKGLKP